MRRERFSVFIVVRQRKEKALLGTSLCPPKGQRVVAYTAGIRTLQSGTYSLSTLNTRQCQAFPTSHGG